jgi:hypothetical protein
VIRTLLRIGWLNIKRDVFWRDAPVWQLWPQVAVLGTLTALFLSGARLLARRWESA